MLSHSVASRRSLDRPPIVEAIADVRWGGEQAGERIYDAYEIWLGEFAARARGSFPRRERLHRPAKEAFCVMPGATRMVFDRFRGEHDYPLIQLGPGFATYNLDGPGYDWRARMRPGTLEVLDWLSQAVDGFSETLDALGLRALDFFEASNAVDFMRSRLTLELGSGVDKLAVLAGATQSPHYSSTWALADSSTDLVVRAGPGTHARGDGVLVEIVAVQTGQRVRDLGYAASIDALHTLTGEAFFVLVSKEELDARGYRA